MTASCYTASELSDSKQASTDLRVAFESLSQAERDAILDRKSVSKLPAKDINKSETGTVSASVNENTSQGHTSKDTLTDVADGEVVSFLNIFVLWSSGLILP